MLNLTQYLNQKDPVYMPYVVLQQEEYELGYEIQTRTTVPWEIHQRVTIKGIHATYCLINRRGVLHTVDGDGNPKAMSCFHILKKNERSSGID